MFYTDIYLKFSRSVLVYIGNFLLSDYFLSNYLTHQLSRLGGVMVSVFIIALKVCGFKPGRGDGFLTAIKIRSTSSFGEELSRRSMS
jgi:hypothetical protein